MSKNKLLRARQGLLSSISFSDYTQRKASTCGTSVHEEGTRCCALSPHRGQELGEPHRFDVEKKNRCPHEKNAAVSSFFQYAGERAQGLAGEGRKRSCCSRRQARVETEIKRKGRRGATPKKRSERGSKARKEKSRENKASLFFSTPNSSTSSLSLSHHLRKKKSVGSRGSSSHRGLPRPSSLSVETLLHRRPCWSRGRSRQTEGRKRNLKPFLLNDKGLLISRGGSKKTSD